MAGVHMPGDEGTEVQTQSVPSIGGPAQVVAGGHVNDAHRANGVNYNTDESVGVNLDTAGYPAGDDFGESSNPLRK